MKILITGSEGYIGKNLIRHIYRHFGYDTSIIQIDKLTGSDVCDLKFSFFETKPDVMVHLASVAGIENCENNKEQAADVYQTLEKLGKLREQGILTEDEFQTKKRQLLDRL